MSENCTTASADPNATGSGRHVPKYSSENLLHVSAQWFRSRSPYWDINQGDDDGFFQSRDDTLPPSSQRDLVYDTLPRPRWIRILKLEPGVLYSSIKCSLVPIDLDAEHVEYEAVSYTWGKYYEHATQNYSETGDSASESALILCNGVWKVITKSLYHALLLFRRTDRERYLWADGLCINQDSDQEKSYQVDLMQLIYKKAREVLIWVGWRDPHAIENAMHLVCYLVNQECGEDIEKRYGKKALWYDDEEPMRKERIGARPASAESWYSDDEDVSGDAQEQVAFEAGTLRPLVALFEARYFSRLWVFQEVALSPLATMFWGRARIRFEWVALVADLIERNYMAEFASYDDAVDGLQNCARMFGTWRGEFTNQTFFDLLLATRSLKATEPKDKVFGLLGIKTRDSDPEHGRPFVKANYSLSREALFKMVAKEVLVEQQDTRCLTAVEHVHGISKDQPSWVPDFGSQQHTAAICASNTRSHSVIERLISHSMCHSIPDCLSFTGVQADTVSSILGSISDPSLHWRSIATYQRLHNLIQNLAGNFSDSEIATCLTAGFALDLRTRVDDVPVHAAALRIFLASSLPIPTKAGQVLSDEEKISPPDESSPSDLRTAYRFFQASAPTLHRRCLFQTHNGSLGIGPTCTEIGDIVAVLGGGTVPFLLRKAEIEQHFRLVGQSYVCGLMDWHATLKRKGNVSDVTFHIS